MSTILMLNTHEEEYGWVLPTLSACALLLLSLMSVKGLDISFFFFFFFSPSPLSLLLEFLSSGGGTEGGWW